MVASTVVGLVAAALTGCAPGPPAQPPSAAPQQPRVSAAEPTPTNTPDLTVPGAAGAAIEELVAAAGSSDVLMISAKRREVTVSVLVDKQVETWSLRRGEPQQVETDLAYVDQATFDRTDWEFSDLGALFRAAAAVSGSSSGQELQIVDASGGEVRMSVSTNPESRTVFFEPDGTLTPTLDLTSGWGLAQAYREITANQARATTAVFSNTMVYLEHPGDEADTTLRRTRTSWVPVTVTSRPGKPTNPEFALPRDLPQRVWQVVSRRHARGDFELDQPWECTVRKGSEGVTMRFTIGSESFTTDLDGRELNA